MLVNILISLTIGCFVAILFSSFYFRLKVFKAYKILIDNRIQFDASHVFNQKKLEEEILPKYPKHKESILAFTNGIKFSMKCATFLILTVTAFAAILMFVRE